MSRSRRKIPILGIAKAESDKPYKVVEHRRARRVTRSVLAMGLDGDDGRLHPKAYGNPWQSQKDGKQFWNDPRAMRK